MKTTTLIFSLCLLLTANFTSAQNNKITNKKNSTKMENTTEISTIEKLLFNYQDALNASDVNKVLPLYTQDGVFMPQGGPSAIGQEQLKGAYEFVFKNLQLKIKFNIDEIVIVNDHYAFARTVSRGTQLVHATGITGAEENREMFILQKENDQWKISRYIFNKMK